MTASLVDPSPRVLGSLGEVGPLALGQWRFTGDDVGAATNLVETALEHGINLVDTADVYGLDWGGSGFGACEELLGKVLAGASGLRQRIVLATKGGIRPLTPYDSSSDYLVSACEASLRRLQTDVIDLYQIQRPDLLTHPADVAATLASLRAAGKIREVGVSNFTPAQTAALAAHLDSPLVTVQPEYSAAHFRSTLRRHVRHVSGESLRALGVESARGRPLGRRRRQRTARRDPSQTEVCQCDASVMLAPFGHAIRG